LVERHPSLRTAIVETAPGNPVQRVLPSGTPDLEMVDARDWLEEEVKERVIEEFNRGFAIDRPMLRIRVFRSGHRDVMLFAVDHLIVDASSLQICLDDLKDFYSAEFAGTELRLSPTGGSYADFVKWEATLTEGVESERLWSYWKKTLQGDLPQLTLPSTGPRPDVLLPKGGGLDLTFSVELSKGVQTLAKENRTTTFSVALAAFHVLLKMFCRQDDIIIGTSVSRRDGSRWARVVGLFVNVLPLRADLSGNPTFAEHLASVRDAVLGALEHQEFPFPVMVNRLALPRTMQHTPVFQAFLNFLQDRTGELGGLLSPEGDVTVRFGGSLLRPFMVIPQGIGLSEIALQIGQSEGQLVGNLNYNVDIVDPVTAAAMAKSYIEILEGAVRESNRPINELILGASLPSVESEEIFL
jgi:hypothetical protein